MQFVVLRTLCTFLLVSKIESVIRNDITDRCLHIGVLKRQDKESSAYATACTWNVQGGSQSHKDEWLEIVSWDGNETAISPRLETEKFRIQKVTNTSDLCLTSINNKPTVSYDCDADESLFSLEIVHQKNFKGVLTSPVSFKIRNDDGLCLTIQPGQPFLKFKDCSPRQGLFQVWSVCRHNKKCDVDLTWSPRDIIFPKNSTDVTDSDKAVIEKYPTDTKAKITPLEQKQNIQTEFGGSVINEVLFTVQNALRIYDSSEQFVKDGIGAFYTKDSLAEARLIVWKICKKDNLKCSLCTQCQDAKSPANMTVAYLLKWMETCNTSPIAKIFLSSDVFQVPHHLFPSHDPSYMRELPVKEKYKQIIPNLRKYLKELETSLLNEHETDRINNAQEETSHENVSESEGQMPTVQVDKTDATNASIENHEMNNTQDYASIIDIRFNRPHG